MYDAVVVGVGGVGSFAMRALSQQKAKCLGIERFALGHLHGSSHGKTRIYRRAYFENPSYVPWIDYSLQQFQDLEVQHGVSLLQTCGTLILAPSEDSGGRAPTGLPQQQQQLPPRLQASYNSAVEYGIPVEYVNPTQMKDRFPQFQYHQPMVGMFEPEGGFVRPELAMETALNEALTQNSNASVQEHTTVVSFQEIDDYVQVLLKRDDSEETELVETRSLLVSAGGWAGQLLESWSPHLKVIRQLSGWVDVSQNSTQPSELYSYRHMPTFVMDTPEWPYPLYGLPCDSDDLQHQHWVKIGIHGREDVLSNASHNPAELTDSEVEELTKVSHLAYNGLLGEEEQRTESLFAKALPCLYTMTPDTDYIIGGLAGTKRVFGVAGLSGHGYKMTPALGAMMADFALENDMSQWKMDFCSPERF